MGKLGLFNIFYGLLGVLSSIYLESTEGIYLSLWIMVSGVILNFVKPAWGMFRELLDRKKAPSPLSDEGR